MNKKIKFEKMDVQKSEEIKKEEKKPTVACGNDPITNLEFSKFKEEILSLISEKEINLNSKIEKYHNQLFQVESNYEKKTNNISQQYTDFTTTAANINNRLDRLNSYEAFTHKTNDQLISHEIRLTNLSKELQKAINKYDKIFLDNLVLPGYIGECCKFKNAKEFFNDTITQLSLLNTFKEKQTLDLKKYKERLETIIHNFNLQVENNTKANMKYTNEICERNERNFKEKFEELNERLLEMRMENSKYCIELKAKSTDLSKEWDKMLKIKGEIHQEFGEKVEEMKKSNESTVNSFSEVKGEFLRIKRKFYELAEFIKDVRFRKNLGGDVKKREIKTLVNKISFKRKNSYDGETKSKIKGNNEMSNMRNSNHSSKPVRQSQSQEVESRVQKYIKGETNNTLNNCTHRKRVSSKSQRSINKENKKIVLDPSDDEIDDHMKNNSRNYNSSSQTLENSNIPTTNNCNSNNNNNNRYDAFLETNDKIIHELAAELEQSANKIDRITLAKANNQNLNIVNDENNRENTNSNYGNDEEDNHKKSKSNKENNGNSSNSANSSYINVFDVRKCQKDLDKKVNNYQKKVLDLEIFTKQKLLELAKQIDTMNTMNGGIGSTPIIQNLFGKDTNNTIPPQNIQAKGSKVPIIEIGGGNIFNIPNNNNGIGNNNLFPSNAPARSHSKPGKLTRVKTGNQSSRLNKMIMQTLGNTMQEEYNNRNFYPEYKVLKKSKFYYIYYNYS